MKNKTNRLPHTIIGLIFLSIGTAVLATTPNDPLALKDSLFIGGIYLICATLILLNRNPFANFHSATNEPPPTTTFPTLPPGAEFAAASLLLLAAAASLYLQLQKGISLRQSITFSLLFVALSLLLTLQGIKKKN
ncbi:MAG: hypothetical protein D6805_03685 [Planctomycetota bacterium]|nr:MAG: hypothetical protein D6805_03685 [Planctomycetota bacterium]